MSETTPGEESASSEQHAILEEPHERAAQCEDVSLRTRTSVPSLWTDWIPRTEHNALFLDCDYGRTTLGPMQDWGPTLRAYATMVFAQNQGACVYWGPNRVALYNENFAVSCGGAHPFLMGHGFAEAFPELVDSINPVFDMAASTRRAVDVHDIQLFVRRHGYLEETYFFGQFVPLAGDTGEIEGFYNTIIETTGDVLEKRHRKVVDLVASIVPSSIDQTLAQFVEALRSNPHDCTMALLYRYNEAAPPGDDNIHLQASLAVPQSHPCAVASACLGTSQTGLLPQFRDMLITGQQLVVQTHDSNIPERNDLFHGIEWSGYGEPSQVVVICCVKIAGNVLGFYVQGTNPRRQYDEIVKQNITEIVTQLGVKWAASITREQAYLREQALERRATYSENTLRNLAKSAPIGMCQLGRDLEIQWANEQFYEITGHDRSKPTVADSLMVLTADEHEKERSLLKAQLSGAPRIARELRLNRTWTPPAHLGVSSEPINAWILSVTFPSVENEEVNKLLVYITDISHQKWAEGVQARNAEIALQAERRQEEFLDITSHELRNPLSSITQLADGIANSPDLRIDNNPGVLHDIIQDNAEAAKTILACVKHQKRVVDDILTLSRLDSEAFSLNMTAADPSKVMSDTLKMFDGLAAANDIRVSAVKHDNCATLDTVGFVLLDTSRLTQLLVNLLGNAIKFTATQPVREISIKYGVLSKLPLSLDTSVGEIIWFPSMGSGRFPRSLSEEQGGLGERLYAYFQVQDTGPGMTPEGIEMLFKRFSQATTKTQIAYGGSGLGLYICRKIIEMQGGRIGVASQPGKGSVFAFYLDTTAQQSTTLPHESVEQVVDTSTNGLSELRDDHYPPSSPSLIIPNETFDILLVEDNIVNQKILAKQLRKANCNVSVANNGIEALKMLKQSGCWREENVQQLNEHIVSVQVVLMDIEMPVMDGLECTKNIRRLEDEGRIKASGRRLPIIATTANARQGQQDKALACGIDSVLTKPFTVNELIGRIREVVHQCVKSAQTE